MGNLKEKLTHTYLKRIRRWTFCPSCGGKMNINKQAGIWECEECTYTFLSHDFQLKYGFYFCDKCGSFLNNQPGFSLEKKSWICVQCKFENALTADNNVSICINCGKKLSKGLKQPLCDDCKTEQNKVIFWGSIAFIFTLGWFIYNAADRSFTSSSSADEESYPICKSCGARMTDYDGVSWYTCPECGDEVRKNDDGTMTWENEIFGSAGQRVGGPVCERCGKSLRGGSYTMPWESVNNPDGYIICPYCKHVNYQWEDDD